MVEAKNRVFSIVVTAAVVAAFAAIDYFAPQFMEAAERRGRFIAFILGLPFGAFMAQAMLIAAWAVLAPPNIVLRSALWLLSGLTMWYLLVLGFQKAEGGPNVDATIVLGVLVLSGVTILQGPMWLAKQVFRYRMLSPGEDVGDAAQARLQFQLKDLLLAMVIVAIALSPLRAILPKQDIGKGPVPVGEVAITIVVLLSIVLLATLPSLWVAFSRRATFALAVGLALYSLVLAVCEFVVLCAILGTPGSQEVFEVFVAIFAANFGQAAVVFAVMRIYFTLGYRLQRVPRKAARNPEASPPTLEPPAPAPEPP